MKKNNLGQILLSESEAIECLYQGVSIDRLFLEDINIINEFNNSSKMNYDNVRLSTTSELNINEFDNQNQNNWFMPEEYKNLDIKQYIFDQCKTSIEIERVKIELELFDHYKMIDLLKYLKYLVDTMRENKILWGVGRGSSVSSYCLYLLNVHRIDSIKYNLDIHEFLKEIK